MKLYSSCAKVFGYEVYGDCPWLIDKVFYPFFKMLSDARYWLLYRITREHAYHIIYTDLKPGYCDQRERILYGCMQCVCEFVKESQGEEELQRWTNELINDPGAINERQANLQTEALAIYRWWKYERPADIKREAELLHLAYGGDEIEFEETDNPKLHKMVFNNAPGKEKIKEEYRLLEKKIQDDEQAYLIRLINIRPGLWT